ncbi:MAG: hypothetical protein ACKO8O_05240 [Betaproteobacteria bacterium]
MGFRGGGGTAPSGRHLKRPFHASRRICRLAANFIIGVSVAGVAAAPLDPFLEAGPHTKPGTGFVELSSDGMSKQLDLLRLRPDGLTDDSAGVLRGFRIRGGYGLTSRLWVDGGFSRRQIFYGGLGPFFNGWQLGGQWRVRESLGRWSGPDVSVRLNAWGNQAGTIAVPRGTLERYRGFDLLDSLAVSGASDRQLQSDLITTWWNGSSVWTVFAGAGVGRVSVDSIQASVGPFETTWRGGRFDSDLVQSLAPTLGISDALSSINYRTSFVHGGAGVRMPLGNWALRGGYQFFSIQRDLVDSVISARSTDNTVYRTNHTLLGEVAYRMAPGVRVFVRGQAMSNQMLSEMPLLYNVLTARRFNERYGVLSAGLMASF